MTGIKDEHIPLEMFKRLPNGELFRIPLKSYSLENGMKTLNQFIKNEQ